MIRIGTAGWAVPRDVADRFGSGSSALERYATRFGAVEINSTFYRPHRPATYERWAATVGPNFRFTVKLRKTITHEAGLIGAEAEIDRFVNETSALGAKRGPILVQTPPKLAFNPADVAAVADRLYAGGASAVAWEPRHASWFTPEADALLADRRIARVAADPARHRGAGVPGGWRGLVYHRLHGSPRTYYSAYNERALGELAARADGGPACETWVVFDNTASGAAARNALDFEALSVRRERP